jgi:uncharacterized OsmC-like protein
MTILRAVLSGSVLSTAIIFEVVNRPVREEEGVQSCFERPRSLHPRAIEADATGSRMMDANELRTLQAPLKKEYREQPETGRTEARAEATLDLDRVACRVRSWGGETTAGLHPATGGDGSFACSADMLLEALVACAGVTMSAVATAMGVKLRGGRVTAEGHWDARGTLGVDREAPVGLTDIALKFELETDADAATVQRLVEMSERFCVIYQTLRTPPRLSITHRIVN